jgi:methylmalonyl-CoA carboxyltransferase large subunit
MVDVNTAELTETIEELRNEVHRLSERLAVLEIARETSEKSQTPTAVQPPAAPVAAKTPEPVPEPISEEIMLVISAAVAAFMGERAHVRQVRLVHSGLWAQQGRVSIQASHYLRHR